MEAAFFPGKTELFEYTPKSVVCPDMRCVLYQLRMAYTPVCVVHFHRVAKDTRYFVQFSYCKNDSLHFLYS